MVRAVEGVKLAWGEIVDQHIDQIRNLAEYMKDWGSPEPINNLVVRERRGLRK